ncbi:secretory calcium-binding phosphoprotein 9 [Scophthalmus maximus]|uniref:secretory calcium-binding phosphoprotein 9 n=1 Tax=Scophthalmus maximus TaxID=52904 RepID=UPI0015E14568|nr:secretory calcium-binding phosphoprotein 9 [Scophthalmus maximus]
MKFLLLTIAFVVTICYVSAGKTQRMLAAMNAGLVPGVNGALVPGMNAGLAYGANPRLMAGGLNLPMVAGGGAGFIGQPQFPQFVPGLPAFALPAPVPNVYPFPAVNTLPFMGVPQMAQMNPAQQPPMGVTGGAVAQQFPLQADPLRRFRRQIMKQGNNMKTTVDTQIPAPTDTATASTLCDEHDRHEDN